jgi:hypothetical protein
MKTKWNLFSLLCIIAIIALSCVKKSKNTNCENVICTQDFKSYAITVENKSMIALPLILHVTDMNANVQIHSTNTPDSGTSDRFTIFTDLDMQHINQLNLGEQFRVDFIIGSSIVKTEIYSFSKDCCHFSKISGNDHVVVL